MIRAKGPVPQFGGRRTTVSAAPPVKTWLQDVGSVQVMVTLWFPVDQLGSQPVTDHPAAVEMSERPWVSPFYQ